MNNKMKVAFKMKCHLYKGKVVVLRPISDDYFHNMSNGEQYICINYTMNQANPSKHKEWLLKQLLHGWVSYMVETVQNSQNNNYSVQWYAKYITKRIAILLYK